MKPKLKRVKDQTIVITGASSGIGLATARMAAGRGARVVLNARNEADLREATEEIRRRGGRAIAVAADVSDPEDMLTLADRAVSEFGGIDTWVNNAGVPLYGRLTQTPLADKRQLFDVNFWGVVHGCRAALRHLRQHGGAIINIGSIVSDRAIPLQGIYSASKHAVKAYTDALRMELEEEGVPVSVTLVKPSAIDTPYLAHGRNYMEHEPTFPPPVYAPAEVARTILRCAEKRVREITVGVGGPMLRVSSFVAPRLTDKLMERTYFSGQQRDEISSGPGGNLYRPRADGSVRGPYEGRVLERSAYTRAMLSDLRRVVPLMAIGVGVAAGMRRLRSSY